MQEQTNLWYSILVRFGAITKVSHYRLTLDKGVLIPSSTIAERMVDSRALPLKSGQIQTRPIVRQGISHA